MKLDAMGKVIDVIAGLFLLAVGLNGAAFVYLLFKSSFFRSLFPTWWICCLGIVCSAAALSALGLLCFRRRSAIVGVVAAGAMGALFCYERFEYQGPILCFVVAVIVYWRFLWLDSSAQGNAEV
jgi:hypothetical protein